MGKVNYVSYETRKVRSDILYTIKSSERQALPYKEVADMCLVDTSKTTVGRWVKEAKNRGLLQATTQKGKTTIFHEVTESGEDYIKQHHPYEGNREGDEHRRPVQIRLHHSEFITQIQNFENLSKEWKKKVAQSNKWSFKAYDPDNDSIKLHRDIKDEKGYLVTISGDKIMFRLTEDATGYESTSVMMEHWNMAKEAINIVENELGRVIKRKPELVFNLNTQHLAIVRDPFAEFIQEKSDVNLQDVEVRDDEGELRLKLDCSNQPEMEAGWGNKLSTKKYFAEVDIMFVKENLYEFIISNKKKWKAFIAAINEADAKDIRTMFK